MTQHADVAKALAASDTLFTVGAQELFGNDQVPGQYPIWADVVQSSTKTTEMPMIGASSVMAEWLGERIVHQMRAFKLTTSMTPYQATEEVRAPDMKYENLGAIAKRLGAFLAEQAYVYDMISLAKLIANGTGYDEVALLSASHPYSGATSGLWSNLSTNPFTRANYVAAKAAAAAWTIENGRPMRFNATHILHGPAITERVRNELQCTMRVAPVNAVGQADPGAYVVAAGAIPNTMAGELISVETPLLVGTYAYYWYLIDASKRGKPIIIQENERPHSVIRDQENDEARWQRNVYQYALEGDFGANIGYPQTIYGNLAVT